jgi:hypothetical protein
VARVFSARLVRDSRDGWLELLQWLDDGRHLRRRPLAVVSRVVVIGYVPLIIWLVHTLFSTWPSLDGPAGWLAALVVGLAAVLIVTTAVLYWLVHQREMGRRAAAVRGWRATGYRLLAMATLAIAPLWLLTVLVFDAIDVGQLIASDVKVWFWGPWLLLLFISCLKVSEALPAWRLRLEEHRQLSQARHDSEELLRKAADQAKDGTLTTTSMAQLLAISVGDRLPPAAAAARMVLMAVHRGMYVPGLQATIDAGTAELIWAATERLRIAHIGLCDCYGDGDNEGNMDGDQ